MLPDKKKGEDLYFLRPPNIHLSVIVTIKDKMDWQIDPKGVQNKNKDSFTDPTFNAINLAAGLPSW